MYVPRPLPGNVQIDALDYVRVLDAVARTGAPCAVAGSTLAALRGWPGCTAPAVPQLVAPDTRHVRAVPRAVASIRRIRRWPRVVVVPGPHGVPALDVVDSLVTLAPDVDEATLHTLVQLLHFERQLDIEELNARRTTGLPGSAKLSRVLAHYRVGLDSPREIEVYNVLRFWGRAPDHLNAYALSPSGIAVGPFDGLDDSGAAYEVDSAIGHGDEELRSRDARKDASAAGIGVQLVRFWPADVRAREPLVAGWDAARDRARAEGARLAVLHQPWRDCPCGHEAGGPATLWREHKITS